MTTKKPKKTTDIIVPQEVTEALVEMIACRVADRVVEQLTPILLSAGTPKKEGGDCDQTCSGS